MTEPAANPVPPPAPDDWRERAGDRLLAANGDTRAAVLAELVAEHPERAADLRELCAELDGIDRLLRAGYPDPNGAPPSQIGGHRVLRRLGEGAFGVVYLCAQEHPVVRQVAIKVLRPGAGDLKTLQRFAAERQLLAQLNHPGITQVFDAGELPDTRPYFVMEYVDGAPIHAWCIDHELSCTSRVRLFLDVCRAVAHAHARGIVHRDLKPANVLVVGSTDGPVPKVIDFGIAKALSTTGEVSGLPTETGRVVGTPGYMSPEQAAGRVDEVDERADVFALGVMLYQLLTDRLPWEKPATTETTDPLRPSARVATAHGTANRAPAHQPRASELRGDLDWITLKAIARDRHDRYASVEALLRDLERHLRSEPVSAGPPSLTYRIRKFVRRRRTAVIAAASLGVAVAGSAIALSHAQRIQAEGGLADSRVVVANLLRRANDPALFGTAHGDEVRRALGAEALAFSERLLAKRTDDPALLIDRCRALQTLAEVQSLVGELQQAHEVAAAAVAIAERLLAMAPADASRRGLLGMALRQEARPLLMRGDQVAAAARYATAVEHLEASTADDPASWRATLALATGELADVVPAGEAERAVRAFERSLALFEECGDDADADDTGVVHRIGIGIGFVKQLHELRRLDAAQAQIERIATLLPRLGTRRQAPWIEFHRLRGRVAWARGERASTLADFAAAADAADAWCREQPRRNGAHRLRILAFNDLGEKAGYVGDFAASDVAYRRAIAAAEQMIEQFPEDPTGRSQLAQRYAAFARILWDRFRQRDLTEAAEHVARAVEIDASLADEAARSGTARWKLLTLQAQIAHSRGDAATAERWREVEAAVPLATEPLEYDRGMQIEAFVGIAEQALLAGDPAVATWLQRARTIFEAHPIHKKGAVEIAWREARLAHRDGDAAAIASAADRIVAARPTWLGFRRAGDCLRLAADCAADATAAAEFRRRAQQAYARVVGQLAKDVAEHPDDPWYVVPWGVAGVRLAESVAETGEPDAVLRQLEKVMARLDAVRADAHRDQWDEDAWQAGVTLRERLRR